MKNIQYQRTLVLWLALFGFILLLTGCTGVSEKTNENPPKEKPTDTVSADQTLTMAYTWNPGGLDPHGRDSWFVMRSGIGETLIRLNEQLQPTSWLAKEWKQKNEKTWLLKLQENVTFHNGKVVDAESVKNSLQRTLAENQKAKDLLQIESIEVTNPYEIKIITKKPNPALIPNLADPSTIILDVSDIKAFTGAFKIKKFNKDESLVVERFEGYWGEKALLSEVVIKFITDGNTRLMALQSGDVDVATDLPIDSLSLLENDNNLRVLSAPSVRTHMLLFNMNSPLFKDVAYRRVVDMSIPREDIVNSVMKGYGTAANSPFADVLPFGRVEQNQGNQSVEQVMTQGGWQKNTDGIWEKQGKVFEAMLLTYPQRPELSIMAEIIQAELLNVGMKVKIRQVESIDDALTNDDWDLAMYSMLTAHTGDPGYFLNIFYNSNSESNVSRYASNSLDKVIDELNQTSDATKRNELALQAQTIINKDIPQSFIVHPKTIMGARKEVQGFTPNPIEYYYINSQMNLTNSR
jgi:peptide/nickel transport system substrate-binding protein